MNPTGSGDYDNMHSPRIKSPYIRSTYSTCPNALKLFVNGRKLILIATETSNLNKCMFTHFESCYMLFNQNNISRLGKCNTMFGGVNKQAFVNLLHVLDTSFLQLSPGLFTIYHRLFRFCPSFPIVLFFFLYGKYMPCLSHNMLNNTALFQWKIVIWQFVY